MAKCCVAYWNPLYPLNAGLWSEGPGMGGLVAELVLSRDETTGDYTKLTRISPGADMLHFACKVHDYPEEIFVVSGSLYDASCDL